MNLDDIPRNQIDFRAGVYEVSYPTLAEINAYIEGLHAPDDIDVDSGTPFERNGQFVVRVRIGDWGDDDE
jgi:hypothetical protein